MSINEKRKKLVKHKYGTIANRNSQDCGCNCSCSSSRSIFHGDYTDKAGYVASADLGLGCGIPTEFAQIQEGDTVLDLGSGAGNDVFVARSIVGATGRVIGLDFTEEMIRRAQSNLAKLDYQNIEFRLGDIEKLPVHNNEIDVIVSNCVLNLVPDKKKAFQEMYRVLKPGGHFCVSDMVLNGELPERLKTIAELYTGCVAGAIQKRDYLNMLVVAGFVDVDVKKEQQYQLSEEYLRSFFDDDDVKKYSRAANSIISVTVMGKKAL